MFCLGKARTLQSSWTASSSPAKTTTSPDLEQLGRSEGEEKKKEKRRKTFL